MKISLSILVAVSLMTVHGYVDLGPAYNVHMTGSSEWKLIDKIEKDPVFVEGLEFLDNTTLIESVGQYWGSEIRKVTLDFNKLSSDEGVTQSLPAGNFGEGCSKFGDKLYQMTYREGKVFVYNLDTL